MPWPTPGYPVTELRCDSIADVDSARRSARSIVFEMNHQSVAEHAVFNFDILDISRLCVESLEWHRLCSYTEKSQRYQELVGDHIVPKEFEGSEALGIFEAAAKEQNELYERAYKVLLRYHKEKNPGLLKKKSDIRTVEGFAKEDARYCVSLATKAQLGFTANARNLEYVIRTLRGQPLAESRQLGDEFFKLAGSVAPSLILLTDPKEYEKEFKRPLNDDYFCKREGHAREVVAEVLGTCSRSLGKVGQAKGDATLLDFTPDADMKTMAAILFSHSSHPYSECLSVARSLDEMEDEGREILVKEFFRHSNPWESASREFETTGYTFELALSSACFGQMKRHRMCTQLTQPYDPELGCTYPPSVVETGLQEEFEGVYDLSTACYHELSKYDKVAAQYILTNGHKRKMLLQVNARELYHMARLREDPHAQWDIRGLTADMLALAREATPLTLMLAYGKDKFEKKKAELLKD